MKNTKTKILIPLLSVTSFFARKAARPNSANRALALFPLASLVLASVYRARRRLESRYRTLVLKAGRLEHAPITSCSFERRQTMNRFKGIAIAAFAFASVAAVAQNSYPKFEVPIGFSFVNVHPSQALITSFNVFGGGGGFVYNVTPLIDDPCSTPTSMLSWWIAAVRAGRMVCSS